MPAPFDNPPGAPSDDGTNGGLVAKPRPGDNAEPLSVSEISASLKRVVEDRFGHVRLRGELSGVKRAASGHLYCCLKDEKAVIDGVMWRGNAGRLAFAVEDGLDVIASGKVTTYPGRSKYQIVIDRMELAGEGALLALLERNRRRFAEEGLFDAGRKRAIPFLPRTIGVVTSPTGAVIRDILHRLADRFPVRVLVWPVLVQGQGAAEQVARAVRGFSALDGAGAVPRPDVVIVARGGGSIEDLWSFNEEAVVRAVAECSIPVISAVGHETDTTLVDFASDRRAPTPSAAAEMAVPVRADLQAHLANLAARKRRSVARPLALGRERLEARIARLPTAQTLVANRAQALDDLGERLRRALSDRAARASQAFQARSGRLSLPLLRQRIAAGQERLARSGLDRRLIDRRLDAATRALSAAHRLHLSVDPERPLALGYAMVRNGAGAPVTTRDAAAGEALLELTFRDGALQVAPADGSPPANPPARPAKRPARRKTPPAAPDAQPKLL